MQLGTILLPSKAYLVDVLMRTGSLYRGLESTRIVRMVSLSDRDAALTDHA
jgi:hypothetical protein